MFKLTALAIVATAVTAMPHDFKNTPVSGDFPMPAVPWNFEATSYHYIW